MLEFLNPFCMLAAAGNIGDYGENYRGARDAAYCPCGIMSRCTDNKEKYCARTEVAGR